MYDHGYMHVVSMSNCIVLLCQIAPFWIMALFVNMELYYWIALGFTIFTVAFVCILFHMFHCPHPNIVQ